MASPAFKASAGMASQNHTYDIAADTWKPDFSDDNYETVAASQTAQVLGATGAAGDRLRRLVVAVGTAATSLVTIKDGGGSAITIIPANATVGTYSFEIGARSTAGAWSVTTLAGSTVVAIGSFT